MSSENTAAKRSLWQILLTACRLPAALLLSLGVAVALWKSHTLLAVAGNPVSGEALTTQAQRIPYGLALAWRWLAVGLGAGALTSAVAAAVAWSLRSTFRPTQTSPPTHLIRLLSPLPRAAWLCTAAAAALGFSYGFLHVHLSQALPFGDESSYLMRGQIFAAAITSFDLKSLFRWVMDAGHRPWPGLLPVYIGSLFGLSQAALVGVQAAAAWAALTLGLVRVGQVANLRSGAVALAWALVVTQSLWRSESTYIHADLLLSGVLTLALAETMHFIAWQTPARCLRAGMLIGLCAAIKPGGNLWAVVPLSVAAAGWLILAQNQEPWQTRAGWVARLAGVVAVAATVALLVGGGPMVWARVVTHGTVVEGLGYYDEAVSGGAQRGLWLLGVLPRLATVPLLLAALWGAVSPTRTQLNWTALIAIALPLAVHAFAMESKSLRLVSYALPGLGVLAAAGVDDLSRRWRSQSIPIWIAGCLAITALALDFTTPADTLVNRHLSSPVIGRDWRQVDVNWLGSNPITHYAERWRPVAAQFAAMVDKQCDLAATTPLYSEPRLAVAGRDSGYGKGISPRSHYVPELRPSFEAPMVQARGCLLVHSAGALSWPGGHGRLSGEGLIQKLATLVTTRTDPLAKAFHVVGRQALPDGNTLLIYRRDADADLQERAAWAEQLAAWMPMAGLWSAYWYETGVALLAAPNKSTSADTASGAHTAGCLNLWRAVSARPIRGLVPCERVDLELCYQAVIPGRKSKKAIQIAGCSRPSPAAIWPDGVPAWIERAALPTLATADDAP